MTSNVFHQKYRLFFLVGGIILCIYVLSQGVFFAENTFVLARLNAFRNENACVHPHTSLASDHVGLLKRPDFQSGMVYIQWGQDGYGRCNTQWQKGLDDVHTQTGARWLEMPITFTQNSQTTTHIVLLPTTPSAQSFREGIVTAHKMGYHVFVVPLMSISNGTGRWSGSIHFTNVAEEQQWFDNYWQVFRPYIVAAAQGGADQVAVGTEDEWLEQHAPASVWNRFIAQVHSIFSGTLTYDMNWTTLQSPPRAWMQNADLKMIGISAYLPIIDTPERIDPKQIPVLWKNTVKRALDTFAMKLGKPIFISEIGYRNSADTLYHTWYPESTVSPPDPVEQAAACDAALANVISDPHIIGIFFWGWEDVQGFQLSGQPAVAVLHKWYSSPQS